MKMSRPLYLDCEFNGNKGHFLSMGIYDPLENKNFYEVSKIWSELIKYNEEFGGMKKWVLDNVVPVFNKLSIDELQLRTNLQSYLSSFEDVIIYADWPEDFAHLMYFLCYLSPNTNIPMKLVPSLKMELITTPDTHKSNLPHNALEDAKALYLNHKEALKNV